MLLFFGDRQVGDSRSRVFSPFRSVTSVKSLVKYAALVVTTIKIMRTNQSLYWMLLLK